VSQALKELVTKFFDRGCSLFPNLGNLGLIRGFSDLLHGFKTGFNVEATHRLGHEVTHQIQIFALSFSNKMHQRILVTYLLGLLFIINQIKQQRCLILICNV